MTNRSNNHAIIADVECTAQASRSSLQNGVSWFNELIECLRRTVIAVSPGEGVIRGVKSHGRGTTIRPAEMHGCARRLVNRHHRVIEPALRQALVALDSGIAE